MTQELADCAPGGIHCPEFGLAEQVLELGEHLLDWLQIGRISRQKEQMSPA
jgi:hypothetical protein